MKRIYRFITGFGIDPQKFLLAIRGLGAFMRDYRLLKRQERASTAKFAWGAAFPCLDDRYKQGGTAKGHYFHQDLLVARRIHANAPSRHVDVGSRVDGFVAHVASFREIEVFDIRPITSEVQAIRFVQADMMNPLGSQFEGYCDSVSCLHALEHFGLGRYGDAVDYDGYLKGLQNLTRLLKAKGKLYLSVPIGKQQIQYNAHRVFSVEYILNLVDRDFQLDRFSFVDDAGALHDDVAMPESRVRTSFGCDYGCGIFEMTKR